MNPPGRREKPSASFLGSATMLSIASSFFLIAAAVHAQVPHALEYSIPAPPGVQPAANLGASVAVGGNYVVAGAPLDDTPGSDSGVVKIFDSRDGTLLHVVLNPTRNQADSFGISVAISGSVLVVGGQSTFTGVIGKVHVYDLSSATPTVPVAVLENPSSAVFDGFGRDVAISGTLVVVGAPLVDTGIGDSGKAYVYDLSSGTPSQPVATLNNPTPATGDQFGGVVTISGTRVVVGARFDDTGAINTGCAYVYDLTSETPTVPVATLNNPTPGADDNFGSALVMVGPRVVIGASGDDTGATDAGSVYVYDLTSAQPTVPVFALSNPDLSEGDRFGVKLAMSGVRVVVGANLDDTGASDTGSAYIYDLSRATPMVAVAVLHNPAPGVQDVFGGAVAISGTQVAVGAPGDDAGSRNTGSAYLYDLTSGTPAVPVATMSDPGPSLSGDDFGHAVAISGTRVVVGARFDDTGTNNAGGVHVYDLTRGPELPEATLDRPIVNPEDFFGSAVAISGTRVVVGFDSDDTGGLGAGSAYVYDLTSSTPTLPVVYLYNPDPRSADSFGDSVAISGTLVVVGVPGDDVGAGNDGSVYVYDLNMPAAPAQTLNNPEPAPFDEFGSSVAISGTLVVVGVPGDDVGAGNDGSAYVYDLSSATPTVPTVILRNPSPAAEDRFGNSVAISGTRIVVAARLDDMGAPDAGSAYVYDLSSATPEKPVATFNNPSPSGQALFGYTVGISGARVVVGAYGDDTGATDAGRAYIYDLGSATPTVPVATLNNPEPATGDNFGLAVGIDGDRAVIGAPDDGPRGAVHVYAAGARSLNISTRLNVGTGDRLTIAGFIISGNAPKSVLLRALGPSLAAFGINDALLDPVLELRNSDSSMETNDNWGDSPRRSEFEGGPLQPGDSRESVVLQTVAAGNYTALLTGKNNTAGVGTVEVYDQDLAADAQLANISTRGFVETGNHVMIGGFILGGTTINPEVALRGLGPSLAQFGLNPVLEDPTLELRDANGALLVENDDWKSDSASAAILSASGLGLSDTKEAGIFTALPPGQFTAILAGKDGGIGIGLVEVYNLR